MSRGLRVFTVPPDVAFLPALARAILAGGFPEPGAPAPHPHELPDWTVLLPTRRATRALTAAFLAAVDGRALVLPRMRPLGDIDEDAFCFSALAPEDTSFAVPPAIGETQQLFLLARLIDEWVHANPSAELATSLIGHPGQVFGMARSLIELIEGFDTEEVTLDALAKLTGPDFARHRQAMLAFLNIIRTRWPQELRALGLESRARRRSLLMREQARRLAAQPYSRPIIVAGSTGTIPATANLLEVIAGLPLGAVVLPGLDQMMDDASWQETLSEESHPQHGMHRLLRAIVVERAEVRLLPGIVQERPGSPRLWLAGELMRPAATSDRWKEMLAQSGDSLPRALERLQIIEAPDETREALVIALILRSALERPGLSASLITPDRRLARRVKAELGRWRIEAADSAGEPLARLTEGTFMRQIAELGASRTGPRELAALLKNQLFTLARPRAAITPLIELTETALLRGVPPVPGLKALQEVCARRRVEATTPGGEHLHLHPAVRRLTEEDWTQIADFVAELAKATSAFLDLCATNEPRPLRQYLHAHLMAADALSHSPGVKNTLWRGPGGEALAELFNDLLRHADQAPPLRPADYIALLNSELEARQVWLPHAGHPRISILGLLEARLVKSDIVVLGGLTQNVWPPKPRVNPWLSRPMKEVIGLSQAERRIGLAAHDFVQNFAGGEVYLTCARKIDGEPVVPSRFLLRLGALIAPARHRIDQRSGNWLHWAATIDQRRPTVVIGPAAPAPPVHLRPRKLSVTRIAKLIENPYRIFAENILALRELDPLGKPPGAAERGTAVHEAIRRFCERANDGDIADEQIAFLDCLGAALARIGDTAALPLWWPRFKRMARWFVAEERKLRENSARQHFEVPGSVALPLNGQTFTITARADRIDVLTDGHLRIIDYKTGKLPSYKEVAAGLNPQLALEAWLAMAGAFAGVDPGRVSELTYMRLTGGPVPGEVRPAHKTIPAAALAENAAAGLRQLLAQHLDPDTPYLALADKTARAARRGGIQHLARADEWRLAQ